MTNTTPTCADCGTAIGHDNGPRDGWQLEDGRTVCHACCVADTMLVVEKIKAYGQWCGHRHENWNK